MALLRRNAMRATLMLLPLLSGCVSISYTPIYADSPPPAFDESPLCKAAPGEQTLTLLIGTSCVFPIRGDVQLTRTPVAVEPGETYRVTVPRNQVWYDADRRNTPPQGERGSALMNAFKHWKRQKAR